MNGLLWNHSDFVNTAGKHENIWYLYRDGDYSGYVQQQCPDTKWQASFPWGFVKLGSYDTCEEAKDVLIAALIEKELDR